MVSAAAQLLLSDADPPPVEVLRRSSRSPLVLLCEHAGQAVPAALGDLGVGQAVLDSHRGWDIGAESLARGIADALDAPLVVQRYSRLVIDCNRPPGSAQSIPGQSDNCDIPANRTASQAERDARLREIFTPMDREITTLFEAAPRAATMSVHSFTPRMDGRDRPMHAGFLSRRSTETAEALMRHISARRPDLQLALNAPYQVDDETDWFIPRHAERRGLPHCLIEIRNDQIADPKGIAVWTELLSGAIGAFMESLR